MHTRPAIISGYYLGTSLYPEAKTYRLLADIFNDLAIVLDTLSPYLATIAFSAVSTKLIDLLHSPAADPNALTYMNARDADALHALAPSKRHILTARRAAIAQLLADNQEARIRVSEKTRAFWEVKKVATEKLLDVYDDADTPAEKLDDQARARREAFLKDAADAWVHVRDVLTELNQELIGPYVLGGHPPSLREV